MVLSRDFIAKFFYEVIKVLKRFPLAVLCSGVFCILAIGLNHELPLSRVYLVNLFNGLCWFLSLKLFVESKKWSLRRYYLIGLAGFVAIIIYPYIYSYNFIFLSSSLFLSIFIAPFIRKDSTDMNIWNFCYKIWKIIGFSILIVTILTIGLVITIISVNSLFDIAFYRNTYIDILIVAITFLSPLMVMAKLPSKYDKEEIHQLQNVRFIVTYILFPFIWIYIIILYIYILKIITLKSLPKGEIVLPIFLYWCSGILLYLISYPFNQYKFISYFRKNFFKISLVPFILFGIGIGIRIYEYGVTGCRYAVVICLIWFILCFFWSLKNNRPLSIKFILMSLTILLMFSSFGPWSAENISQLSQSYKK